MILIGMILLTGTMYYIYEKHFNCNIDMGSNICHSCGHEIKEDLRCCLQCKEPLRKKCHDCGKL
ncbi:hypothetical protein SAMN02745975_01293 [Geosporobacter subterraneus DSM 17957]|uniref:Double zinc ribbon n=1 Tax=Geosporobacter subterraneus DSM 17957 TaxID=1121919 RepID=A0A1M6GJS5_9FIRM|nr:hypothetical protein SAMN02745975_01293 [Geosporobacter subterraneus DSM 17957]